MEISYCPRCDVGFSGATKDEANAKVRDHLVKAQVAPLDEGLHDFALQQWDDDDEIKKGI